MFGPGVQSTQGQYAACANEVSRCCSTLIGGATENVESLLARLQLLRERLGRIGDRVFGMRPEPQPSEVKEPSAGSYNELQHRLTFAHMLVDGIEVELTRLQDL